MWTRSALVLAIAFAGAATLAAQSPRFGVGGRRLLTSSRPGRRDRAGRRRLARRLGNRRGRTHGLRRSMRQLPRSEWRRRRRGSRARRWERHARDGPASQDGWEFLASGDDGVGLRESSDAVRSARPLEAGEVYAVVAYTEPQRHHHRRCRDERQHTPTVKMPNRDGFVADPRPDVGLTNTRKPKP